MTFMNDTPIIMNDILNFEGKKLCEIFQMTILNDINKWHIHNYEWQSTFCSQIVTKCLS